jgi:hypothetical protein
MAPNAAMRTVIASKHAPFMRQAEKGPQDHGAKGKMVPTGRAVEASAEIAMRLLRQVPVAVNLLLPEAWLRRKSSPPPSPPLPYFGMMPKVAANRSW